jgi:hypothetical protein
MDKAPGAQFEITIDGMPRTYRDLHEHAIGAAELLKGKNPHSVVAVRDLRTDEKMIVTGSR